MYLSEGLAGAVFPKSVHSRYANPDPPEEAPVDKRQTGQIQYQTQHMAWLKTFAVKCISKGNDANQNTFQPRKSESTTRFSQSVAGMDILPFRPASIYSQQGFLILLCNPRCWQEGRFYGNFTKEGGAPNGGPV